MSAEYRVQLDVFSGPLDLLLYLIRREELDIQDIPIARLTQQYLEYVHLLETLDPDAAGDFLLLAATLVELKSRALLPSPPLEGPDADEDPRRELVRQLLEYKRYKDAAEALRAAAERRAQRYARAPAGLTPGQAGLELEEAGPWDLLRAFGRVMSAIGRGPGVQDIRYDDTPLEVFIERILDRLARRSPLAFGELFGARAVRAEVIGLFLALLELIRDQRVRAEQDRAFGTIYLFLLAAAAAGRGPAAPGRPAIAAWRSRSERPGQADKSDGQTQ